ncbi:MAG: N-acetylmuramoyl-L-alanine amidase, partial [Rhodosalinus sp.]
VLHYTAMESAQAALARLCDPAAEVSAHYLIGTDGHVWRLVEEARRAWHAGRGAWGGIADVNSASIGIELHNRGDHPFPAPQMAALEGVLRGVTGRWDIGPEGVLGHSDCAVGRKRDPGPRFDWRGLARAGLAVWPEAGTPGNFLADAARAGWRAPAGCEDAEGAVLAAVRLRLRPWATGPVAEADRALVAGLAARWPAPEA